MSNKNFLTISKNECSVAYKQILANSEKHWEQATMLSGTKDYGLAISMSIISIEELVKSIVILVDSKGFEFRKVKGMNVFFTNHQIRYLIAYFMFVIGVLGDEFLTALTIMKQNPKKVKKFNALPKTAKDRFMRRYKFYFLRKIILFKEELSWFAKVDLFRQEGFYCDYKEQLTTPLEISEKEFEEVLSRLNKVRNVGKKIVNMLEVDGLEADKQLQEMQEQFNNRKIYDLVSDGLNFVSKNRNKLFDSFIGLFAKY